MSDALAVPRTVYPAGEDFLLLQPAQQAYAYRNVDRLFATRTIRHGPQPKPLPRGAEIEPRYVLDGTEVDLDRYMSRANVAGLLVVANGAIRLERYSLGLEEGGRWSSMSMIKSFTSTLVGAALRDGAIESLDDPVARYVTALRGSAYEAVTVRHLLTMSSGLAWNEDYTDRSSHVNRYSKSLGDKVPGGVLALMRELTAEHAPGSVFRYNTGDTYVLGCLVTAAVGQPLADYMAETIWQPAGMEFDAFYTLESPGGQEIGGSRAGIALRDFGRFGLFILADGTIGDKRVLPDGWVAAANGTAFSLRPEENAYGAVGYGYSWWLDPDGAMVAVGFAGQTLYINRPRGIVVVTLSCQPQPPYTAAPGFDYNRERTLFKDAVLASL